MAEMLDVQGLEKLIWFVVLSIGKCAPVAQGIERRFPKPCVGGSNPLGSAKQTAVCFSGGFIINSLLCI